MAHGLALCTSQAANQVEKNGEVQTIVNRSVLLLLQICKKFCWAKGYSRNTIQPKVEDKGDAFSSVVCFL